MPIVAVVVLTALFWVVYWFVRMGGLEHYLERAARRKEERRKAQARERDRTALLRAIDDPRDAALVLMLLIPRGGDPTPQQLAAIEQAIAGVFQLGNEAVARMTQARFIAGSVSGFADAAKLMAPLFRQRLTADEQRELIAMLRTIARHDGPSPLQIAAIDQLEQRLGAAFTGESARAA